MNDIGAGSLRQAILDANATSAADSISFHIAGTGVQTIKPASALPIISYPLTIDGYTQPDSSPNTLAVGDNASLMIELSGVDAPLYDAGLVIAAGSSTVRGLVIDGFTGNGIFLQANGGNVVEGNYIGTDATGAAPLGNGGFGGIFVWHGATNTFIGGTATGAGNTIAFNLADGVKVMNSSTGNAIEENSIQANTGLGINLVGGSEDAFGVTANHTGFLPGSNDLQNYPLLTVVSRSSGSTTIEGTLSSTPNSTFRLEFFANSSADPSGHGEGQTFLGAMSVTTDGNGNVTFSAHLLTSLPAGQNVISATATA